MKTIKQFLQSDSAISFGFIVITAFLISGTALWIELILVFNQLFTPYNAEIAVGQITVQNQQAMQFHQNIIIIIPLIMLLGLGAWGIVRSLEKRNEP